MSNEEPNLQKGIDAIKKIVDTEEVKKYFDGIQSENTGDKFNIFRMVSEKLKETYHSRILKNMLEQYPGLCNAFLEHIGVSTSNYTQPEITCESDNRIDILIKGAGHCVIIESKINEADDQEGQLCRYYKYCTAEVDDYGLGLIVDKIIYLSPIKGKIPSAEAFADYYEGVEYKDNKHEDNVSKVLEKLCILYSASDNDTEAVHLKGRGGEVNPKGSLVSCLEKYLKDYLKEQSDNYVDRGRCTLDVEKTIFLQHYIKLLKDTQKNERMLKMSLEFLKGLKEEDMKNFRTVIEMMDKSSEARAKETTQYFGTHEIEIPSAIPETCYCIIEKGQEKVYVQALYTKIKSIPSNYKIEKSIDMRVYLAIGINKCEDETNKFFDRYLELQKYLDKEEYKLKVWYSNNYAYVKEFEWDKENELHEEIERVLEIIKQLP